MNTEKIILENRSFDAIRQWLSRRLKSCGIADAQQQDTHAIFEELFAMLSTPDSGFAGMTAQLSVSTGLTGTVIRLQFAGARFVADYDAGGQNNPGLLILQEYSDRIHFDYRRGVNTLTVAAKRRSNKLLYASYAALGLAAVCYAVLSLLAGEGLRQTVTDVIGRLLQVFFDAVLLLSGPVTFFSIITNLTNCIVRIDHRVSFRSLLFSILRTSVGAIVIATGIYYAVGHLVPLQAVAVPGFSVGITQKVMQSIRDVIPESIFAVFTELSPLPLILTALVTAGAICTMDKYFTPMKTMTDAINDLNSRMLALVMALQPAATFLAVLDLLLRLRGQVVWLALGVLGIAALSGLIMLLADFAELAAGGIRPIPFFKKCLPALQETGRVNSCIDAAPYLSQYMGRTFGIDRNLIRDQVRILTQINLDGNCLMLTLITLLISLCSGQLLRPEQVVLIGLLVLGLSVGAPNQPGSVMVGMSILTRYLNVPGKYASSIVLLELVLGSAILFLNTFGVLQVIARIGRQQGCFKGQVFKKQF